MSLLDSTIENSGGESGYDTGVSNEGICLTIYPADANELCRDASVSYSIRTTAETRIFR